MVYILRLGVVRLDYDLLYLLFLVFVLELDQLILSLLEYLTDSFSLIVRRSSLFEESLIENLGKLDGNGVIQILV